MAISDFIRLRKLGIYHITHLFFIVKVRNYFQLQDKYPPQSQIIHSNRNSLQKIQEVCQQDKYGCKQQKDIKTFSLDEVTKAIASLPMILKIHSVLMYHGISEDNT